MTRLSQLPRLQDRPKQGVPKDHASRARPDRLLGQLWRAAVWTRDEGRDRYTGELLHTGDCHHLEPRRTRAVRWDRRNGILLSRATHEAVTRHRLAIRGTRWFTVRGRRYINGDYPVRFVVPRLKKVHA